MGSGALPCVRDIATLNEDARTRERRSLGAPDIGLSALRTCAEDRLRHEGPADPPRRRAGQWPCALRAHQGPAGLRGRL